MHRHSQAGQSWAILLPTVDAGPDCVDEPGAIEDVVTIVLRARGTGMVRQDANSGSCRSRHGNAGNVERLRGLQVRPEVTIPSRQLPVASRRAVRGVEPE